MSGTVVLARGGIVPSQDEDGGKSREGNDDGAQGGGESKDAGQCT